jgi:YHS domain-containing protein
MGIIRQVARLLPLVLLAACTSGRAESADGDGPRVLVNVDRDGVALKGYDPVAYFTDNKAVKGDRRFSSSYNGGIYHFASAEHKAMFDAEPMRYEPQFGGYCGYAASINKVSDIGPEWFEILDGRLVLQHNAKAWRLWHEDVAGNLIKADSNWPGLVRREGKPIRTVARRR